MAIVGTGLWFTGVETSIAEMEISSLTLLAFTCSIVSFILHKRERTRAMEAVAQKSEEIIKASQKEADRLAAFLNSDLYKDLPVDKDYKVKQ